jgi:hypothetical protein
MIREECNGWKAKIRPERKNRKLNSVPRSLGTFQAASSKTRTNTIRVSRTNRNESNIITINLGEGIPGGIARQLIEQAEKQLAYHKAQVSELEARLQELHQFTEILDKENRDTA